MKTPTLPPAPKTVPLPSTTVPTQKWDAVDEASWESFPASDPPSTSPLPQKPAPAPTKPQETDKASSESDHLGD